MYFFIHIFYYPSEKRSFLNVVFNSLFQMCTFKILRPFLVFFRQNRIDWPFWFIGEHYRLRFHKSLYFDSVLFSYRLSAGSRNTLFYFTLLSTNSGIFVSPNHLKTTSSSNDKVTFEILFNYTNACQKINKWFNKNSKVCNAFD